MVYFDRWNWSVSELGRCIGKEGESPSAQHYPGKLCIWQQDLREHTWTHQGHWAACHSAMAMLFCAVCSCHLDLSGHSEKQNCHIKKEEGKKKKNLGSLQNFAQSEHGFSGKAFFDFSILYSYSSFKFITGFRAWALFFAMNNNLFLNQSLSQLYLL